MKKFLISLISILLVFSLLGCGRNNRKKDYPASIMVDDTVYYSTGNAVPVEVDESALLFTVSYAVDGVPKKNGEANFGRDAGVPYAVLEDGMVVVLIGEEWIEFDK